MLEIIKVHKAERRGRKLKKNFPVQELSSVRDLLGMVRSDNVVVQKANFNMGFELIFQNLLVCDERQAQFSALDTFAFCCQNLSIARNKQLHRQFVSFKMHCGIENAKHH